MTAETFLMNDDLWGSRWFFKFEGTGSDDHEMLDRTGHLHMALAMVSVVKVLATEFEMLGKFGWQERDRKLSDQ